jgi:hypothetical protein
MFTERFWITTGLLALFVFIMSGSVLNVLYTVVLSMALTTLVNTAVCKNKRADRRISNAEDEKW